MRVWTWEREENRTELEIHEILVYVDEGTDGLVDRIEAGKTVYLRGTSGSAGLFDEADRRVERVAHYLSIGHFREKWRDMEPEALVDAETGYGLH